MEKRIQVLQTPMCLQFVSLHMFNHFHGRSFIQPSPTPPQVVVFDPRLPNEFLTFQDVDTELRHPIRLGRKPSDFAWVGLVWLVDNIYAYIYIYIYIYIHTYIYNINEEPGDSAAVTILSPNVGLVTFTIFEVRVTEPTHHPKKRDKELPGV